MSEIKRKWFWAWDFDKEEAWINQMAAEGKVLTDVAFTKYTFEDCEPRTYTIRMELLQNFKDKNGKAEYIDLIKSSGAEVIGEVNGWLYCKKRNADGDFELFSDVTSKVEHLNRLRIMLGLIGIAELGIGANSVVNSWRVSPLFGAPIGMLLLFLSVFILFGYFRITSLKNKLEKENTLFES